MRCPVCSNAQTEVRDTRQMEDRTVLRRRRFCRHCQGVFLTYERVKRAELWVIKRDGQKRPFEVEKIRRAITMALRKRPVDATLVEERLQHLVKKLEMQGKSEILTTSIGEAIMDMLQQLDTVAYVRFASVYQDFRDTKDFNHFIASLPQSAYHHGREK
jgi:transcriptional repressor NrdR